MFSPLVDTIVPTQNYGWRRQGYPVNYIVVHTTQGSGQGAVAWFRNPASQVSAHYVIMEDGEIVGMVDELDTAWHAGRVVGTPTHPSVVPGVNPNVVSIGIEFAGYAAAPLGPQQISSGAALIRDIRNRYGRDLPIVAHSEISPGDRSDPGGYNLEWIRSETEDMPYDAEAVKAEIRNMLLSPEGANLVEFAVSRPGGFGEKLAAALGRRVTEAVKDAMAEALSQ